MPPGYGPARPELDQPGFVRMQLQPELRQPLAKVGQQPLRVGLMLETHDEVVREADDDHITVRLVTSPPCHPQGRVAGRNLTRRLPRIRT